MFTFEGSSLSPTNLNLSKRKSFGAGTKKSSFSKKSSRSVEIDNENFDTDMKDENNEMSYLYRINGDFE